MKKFVSILTVVLLFSSALFLNGCDSNNKTQSVKSTDKTTDKAQTSASKKGSVSELKSYLLEPVKGENPLYGTWKIKGVDVVSFIFRNDNLAQMVMGTEADFASLSVDDKNKTLSVSFVLGLNGDYSYKLSKDKKELTLTSKDKKIKHIKQKDYNLIPKAPKKPEIDSKILGWWKSEDKQIYFFSDNGIMYSNNISMETCYSYNAKNGKINAIYNYGGDVKISLDYSCKKGNLIINGTKFKQF